MSAPYRSGFAPAPIYLTPKVNFGWIGESWEIFKLGWQPWIILTGLNIAAFVLFMLIYFASTPQMRMILSGHPQIGAPNPFGPGPGFAIQELTIFGSELIYYVAVFLLTTCSIHIAVCQVRGEVVPANEIFAGLKYWPQALFFMFIMWICELAGTLALCVGVFVAIGLLLPGLAMVGDGVPALDAVNRSVNAMKSDWLNAALFSFVYLLILVVSELPCYLGLIATYPMMFIISALAYRDMVGMPNVSPGGYAPGAAAFPPAHAPGVWPPPPSGANQGWHPDPQSPGWPAQPPSSPPFGTPPSDSGTAPPPPNGP